MYTEEEAKKKECKLGEIAAVISLLTVRKEPNFEELKDEIVGMGRCQASECMMWVELDTPVIYECPICTRVVAGSQHPVKLCEHIDHRGNDTLVAMVRQDDGGNKGRCGLAK